MLGSGKCATCARHSYVQWKKNMIICNLYSPFRFVDNFWTIVTKRVKFNVLVASYVWSLWYSENYERVGPVKCGNSLNLRKFKYLTFGIKVHYRYLIRMCKISLLLTSDGSFSGKLNIQSFLCCYFRSECRTCSAAAFPVSCTEPNAEEVSAFADCRRSDTLRWCSESAYAWLAVIALVTPLVASGVSYEAPLWCSSSTSRTGNQASDYPSIKSNAL
jgi:hypothetical protein